MEDQDISKQVSKELALRDLGDIADLRKSDGFNRYFLRRLNQKRNEVEKKFRYDSAVPVDKEDREILRRLMLAYEELVWLLDVDESSAKIFLSLARHECHPGQSYNRHEPRHQGP